MCDGDESVVGSPNTMPAFSLQDRAERGRNGERNVQEQSALEKVPTAF